MKTVSSIANALFSIMMFSGKHDHRLKPMLQSGIEAKETTNGGFCVSRNEIGRHFGLPQHKRPKGGSCIVRPQSFQMMGVKVARSVVEDPMACIVEEVGLLLHGAPKSKRVVLLDDQGFEVGV